MLRDEFEEAVRFHVMGSNSTLDRNLRGLTSAEGSVALALPLGETIGRSYTCAQYSLFGHKRGVLYVCRTLLVWQSGTTRLAMRFADLASVTLQKAHWSGSPSVVLTSRTAPHKLEVRALQLFEQKLTTSCQMHKNG